MKPSPRQEALNAILEQRSNYPDATIDAQVWTRLVTIAWDNRTQSGDRREIQRTIRQVLLDAARQREADDNATA